MIKYISLRFTGFITHKMSTEIGECLMLISGSGNVFLKVSILHTVNIDIFTGFREDEILYIDAISVNEDSRKHGNGSLLLEIAEQIAIDSKKRATRLIVKENSWMEAWYIRQGYQFTEEIMDNNIMFHVLTKCL